MDFRYTEDQLDLIEAAREFFLGENTVERMRAIAAGEDVPSLWPQLSELGLIGVMAQEEAGGLGQPLSTMVGIAEAAGYTGLPEYLVELAGVTVPEIDDADLLADIFVGRQHVGLSSPLRPVMQDADRMDRFIGGTPKISPIQSIDPLRRLFMTSDAPGAGQDAAMRGAVLTSAKLVGLSARMIDMSVEYAKDREQFGKPIGSFQAVKHHLASAHTAVEFTRPMVQLAALTGGRNVHMAKIASIDTSMMVAETAIQIFGGMGYTFEADLHLFMKRVWSLCGDWGDRNYHMRALEDTVLADGANLGPGTTLTGA